MPEIEKVEIGTAGAVLLARVFEKPDHRGFDLLDLSTVAIVPPTIHE